MPQRVRNSQTFSPLKAQPRAATAALGGESRATNDALTAARLQQQLQMAYLQQTYMAQARAALAQQQAAAAQKAVMKQRQLASRRARREAELARRESRSTNSVLAKPENALAAVFK